MLSLLNFLLEGETTTGAGNGQSIWYTIIPLALVVVVFYFFMIRPQKKQEKAAQDMRNSIEVGDEIVTIGGIIGQVVSIKGDTITIVSSRDRTKIRFLKTAIREVTVKANAPQEAPAAPAAPAVEPAPEKKDEEKTEE